MLAQRRQGFEQRLPQVRGRAGSLDVATQQARLAQLGAELAQAEAAGDGLAFADERERGLRERIAGAMDSVARLEPAEQQAGRERLRLAEGALIWQLARDYPARQWSARKQLAGLDDGLREAEQRLRALEQAQREEPVRLQAFAARIAEIRSRLATLAPRVAVLAAEQQGQAQELAAAELQRQRERLAGYEAQARWAIAQLHDRARLAQAPGAADVTR
jgi:chromosome segregation ATPase